MAKAQIISATKLVEVEVPHRVIIDITYQEAQVLLCILGKIGGHPDKTPRGKSEKICDALRIAGVEDIKLNTLAGHHNIYFDEY